MFTKRARAGLSSGCIPSPGDMVTVSDLSGVLLDVRQMLSRPWEQIAKYSEHRGRRAGPGLDRKVSLFYLDLRSRIALRATSKASRMA